MIGLIYLVVMGGHLLLSIWVVLIAIKEAKKNGKPGWRYGVPVGIVMFHLLYWDYIPTHAVHRYHCLVDGGFTVNKSLEEWMEENPGVAETLNPDPKFSQEEYFQRIEGNIRYYRLPDGAELQARYSPSKVKHMFTDMLLPDGEKKHWLNQRFAWKTQFSKHSFGIRKREEQIIDIETGELLAEYVDFDTDIIQLGLGPRYFRDYRVWLNADSCGASNRKQGVKFNGFYYKVKQLGSIDHG
jgi:hypothetical protein